MLFILFEALEPFGFIGLHHLLAKLMSLVAHSKFQVPNFQSEQEVTEVTKNE